MFNKKRSVPIILLAVVSATVIVLYQRSASEVKKYCAETTGAYRYGAFSKSLDPVKNETDARNRYDQCLREKSFFK